VVTDAAVAKEPGPLDLIPLGRMTSELRIPFVLDGTPSGGRWIFEVESGRFEGERLRASMEGSAAADWLQVGPDGTGTLDVRCLLRTDDDALVFLHYTGRVDLAAGTGPYAAPQFDTGDERYCWLNKVQAVAKGVLDGLTLTYDVYELR